MQGAVFAGAEGRCDARGGGEFRLVALPVFKRQAIAVEALGAGDGKDSGRVESAGKEDDGARILVRGHKGACGQGGETPNFKGRDVAWGEKAELAMLNRRSMPRVRAQATRVRQG